MCQSAEEQPEQRFQENVREDHKANEKTALLQYDRTK